MKAGQELPLERTQRHFGNGSQLLISDRAMVVVAHVSQRRLKSGDRPARKTARAQRACDPGRADDRAFRIEHGNRSEEHTSELQSLTNLVCRLLLEKKKQRSCVCSSITD